MPDDHTYWPVERVASDQAIFAHALREAAEFHDFNAGSRVYTAAQRQEIGQTARIIARRRGWKPLTERLAKDSASG